MKISELKNKKFWPYSFEDSFPEIERVIWNARNKLGALEVPKDIDVSEDYYPHHYGDQWDQACYVLRYLYAYSYEYFMIFSGILEKAETKNGLNVISLGCGAMPDAWSLQEAAKRMKINGAIEYTGVDVLRWSDDYILRTDNTIIKTFIQGKAGDFISHLSDKPFDILIFPKSIGDIYQNDRIDFEKILKSFRETVPLKDVFYVVFSLVDNEKENEKDKQEIVAVVNCLHSRGYEGVPVKNKKVNIGICYSYPPYPMLSKEMCNEAKALAKKHFITSRKYENYYICKFTKVNRDDT